MRTTLYQFFQADPVGTVIGFVAALLVYLTVCVPLICGVLYGFYVLLTLLMRRTERARMLLVLLELGLKDGRTPEAAAMDISASRDSSLGARVQRLSAYLKSGMRLSEALALEPRLLPPQVRTMLNAGERIGDMAR